MTKPTSEQWIDDLRAYCRSLNIDTADLYKVVSDLKVAPMIRGKSFEFSVSNQLAKVLPAKDWTVSKPIMNAQTGIHDVDVMVVHKASKTVVSVECKLAGKGMFKVDRKSGDYIVPVKCMRSRTTKTPAKVNASAKLLGVTPAQFLAHSDQYRCTQFHIVITSLGNAFYETVEDEEGNPAYKFQPTEAGVEFITRLQPPAGVDIQEFVYSACYVVRSEDIAVSPASGVACRKGDCMQKTNCGFIPNYPVINFGLVNKLASGKIPTPTNHWVEIKKCLPIFESFIP